MSMFNRVVTSVPAPQRLLAEEMKSEDINNSKQYALIIEAGLKALYPKEYKKIDERWRDHVISCTESGDSSDYYRLDRYSRKS
jgi:hypothetical protein